MARILITTFGSYGDLHPYIAVALGLKQRGHEPVIATSASYRAKVEAEGLLFHALRPDLDDFGPFAEIARRVYDPKKGAEYLLRELVAAAVRRHLRRPGGRSAAAQICWSPMRSRYAAHLFARTIGLRWVSTILSPMVFMSAYDPPRIPPAPWLKSAVPHEPAAVPQWCSRRSKGMSRGWSEPIRDVLPQPRPAGCRSRIPLFEGQYSPQGTLAMFSPLLAQPQRDWPPHTHVTGFPLHDSDAVDPAADARAG